MSNLMPINTSTATTTQDGDQDCYDEAFLISSIRRRRSSSTSKSTTSTAGAGNGSSSFLSPKLKMKKMKKKNIFSPPSKQQKRKSRVNIINSLVVDVNNNANDDTISNLSTSRMSDYHHEDDDSDYRFPPPPMSSTEFVRSTSTDTRSSESIPEEFNLRVLESSVTKDSTKTSKQIMEELTINKLRLSDLKFHGRSKEIQILHDCLDRMINNNNNNNTRKSRRRRREIVWIHGYTGVGKSSLVMQIRRRVQKQMKGSFAVGKFDYDHREVSYWGIIIALQDLCQQIKILRDTTTTTTTTGNDTKSSYEYDKLSNELLSKLGSSSDLFLLVSVIPQLEDIIIDFDNELLETSSFSYDGMDSEIKSQKLKLAMKSFLGIITQSTIINPLVLVLDDIQWADTASLQFLEAILVDETISNLLIIGCYRSNEVSQDHTLSQTIRHLKELHQQQQTSSSSSSSSLDDDPGGGVFFHVTEMKLDNLGIKEVNQIIMNLLGIDDEGDQTLELATICHKRTNGNGYFLIEFVKFLEQQQYLKFNLGTLQWNWDCTQIANQTTSADNVVDVLKNKMESLAPDTNVRELLTLAAIIGSSSTFDTKTLSLVSRIYYRSDDDNDDKDHDHDDVGHRHVDILLGVVEGIFIEKSTGKPNEYRWVHDMIKQAALSFIPPNELPSVQIEVGMIMLRNLSEEDLRMNLFDVANLLNHNDGRQKQSKKRITEVQMLAAEKAADLSAFESTGAFAANGISLLLSSEDDGDIIRQQNVQLAVRLYSIGAEAEASLGRTHLVEKYCNEVINNIDCCILEKLRAYQTLIRCLGNLAANQEMIHRALDLSLDVLRQLGCKFSSNTLLRGVRALPMLLRIAKSTKNTQKETIMNLPLMTDPMRLGSMKLMDGTFKLALLTKNFTLLLHLLTRMVRWTFKHGISEYSPPAFMKIGTLITNGLGDFQGGAKFAEYALLIQDNLIRTRNNNDTTIIITTKAATTFFGHLLLLSTTMPWQGSLKPLLLGYRSGLQVGDLEASMGCLVGAIQLQFLAGRSLTDIEADCRRYVPQIEEFKVDIVAVLVRITWQTVQNLIGDDSKGYTSVLHGEAFAGDYDELIYIHSIFYSMFQACLHAYFGEFEAGAKLAISKSSKIFRAPPPGHPLKDAFTFYSGISLYAMARKSKRRKFVQAAKRARERIKNRLVKGNVNLHHYVALLNAEDAALAFGSKKGIAEKHYREAVVLAARGGFLQDAALANERYSDFLLNEVSDTNEAMYRLELAVRFYSEWGAERKAEMLQDTLREYHRA